MPLRKGSSKQVIAENIREMRRAGYPRKQAVAAALSSARKSGSGFERWAAPSMMRRKGK